jgi:hypothetical protein
MNSQYKKGVIDLASCRSFKADCYGTTYVILSRHIEIATDVYPISELKQKGLAQPTFREIDAPREVYSLRTALRNI